MVTPLVWLLTVSAARVAVAQDWPVARHDYQRTALQTRESDLDVPAIRWRIPLGGGVTGSSWLVADVDLDGNDEVLLLRGGRVIARRFDGTLAWASEPLGITWILGVDDLDTNGRPEVYAGGYLSGVFALDGSNGAVVWHPHVEPDQRLGDVFPLQADGDASLELYVADRGCAMRGQGTARIFDFSDGFSGTIGVVELDTSEHGYWCGTDQAAGDIDGDGSVEVVTLSNDAVVAYDPVSGEPVFTSPSLGAFPYGRAVTSVVDVDGDGRDEVLVASNEPGTYATAKRLLLVEVVDDSDHLALRWALQLDAEASVHRFARPLAANLVPGGALEIVTSYFDPDGEQWRTIVIDGLVDIDTPVPRLTLEDQALVAVADVDGDGVDELITVDASGTSFGDYGHLRCHRLSAAAGSVTALELWGADAAQLATEPADWLHLAAPISVPGTAGAIFILRDLDGDRRAERLDRADASGVVESFYPTAGGIFAVGLRSLPTHETGAVALSATDGRIALVDGSGSVLNDGDGDGLADLDEQTHGPGGLVARVEADGARLVVMDATRSPVAWVFGADASADSPVAAWRGPEPIETSLLGVSPPIQWVDSGEDLVYRARTADDEIVAVTLDAMSGDTLELYPLVDDGQARILNDVVALRGPDGATRRLIQSYYDPQLSRIHHIATDPITGESFPLDLERRLNCSWERPGAAFDFDDDGHQDVFFSQGYDLRVASGLDGEVLVEGESPSCAGFLTIADLDGDDVPDVLQHGTAGPRALTIGLELDWEMDQDVYHQPAAVAPRAGGGMNIGAARLLTPELLILNGHDGTVESIAVLAGGDRFSDLEAAEAAGARSGTLSAVTALTDLTGEGQAAFLVGSTDGHLYALDAADGELLWALNLRESVGAPIAADLDGDGRSEIAVAAGGYVQVVDRAELTPVPFVYDTDGTFEAASEAEDLDVLLGATRLGANWGAVEGATGYEYQVVREDDAVLVPWTDVGSAQHFAHDDLSLSRGHRYFTLVRAYDRVGAGRVSVDVASDGFEVDDGFPPILTLRVEPFVIFPDDPLRGQTRIVLSIGDDVGLSRYALWIESDDGLTVADLASAELGGIDQTVVRSWSGHDNTGEIVDGAAYTVEAVAFDQSGRSSEVTTDVVVCTADNGDWPECSSSAEDAGDVAVDAGSTDTGSDPADVGGFDVDSDVASSTDTGGGGLDAGSEPDGAPGVEPGQGNDAAGFGDLFGPVVSPDGGSSAPSDLDDGLRERPDEGCGCETSDADRRALSLDLLLWLGAVAVGALFRRRRLPL
jgi:MYXO-CTERM domain-containing protein